MNKTHSKSSSFLLHPQTHHMPPFIIFIVFWFSIFQNSFHFLSANPTPSSCSNGGPRISYPFHLNHPQQPRTLSYEDVPSGFDLFCKKNLTTIHFPSYGAYLVVKSISYPTKRINLLDPRNCVHHVFLNLDLSLTPFQYFYVLKNYTYLNCSTSLSRPFMEIPCMSASDFHSWPWINLGLASVSRNQNRVYCCKHLYVCDCDSDSCKHKGSVVKKESWHAAQLCDIVEDKERVSCSPVIVKQE
ncbi:hypothetical protein K1719_031028 [Acacia pycnantha]|nr:hypothetical protein K1719_031028 [Acacia pycnantha]